MSDFVVFGVAYCGAGVICAAWVLMRRDMKWGGDFLLGLIFEPWVACALLLFWPVWLCAVLLTPQQNGIAAAPKEHVTEIIRGEAAEVVLELRPTGRVKVGHLHFDARDEEGGIVPVGARVVVIGRKLGELTVRKAVGVEATTTQPPRS